MTGNPRTYTDRSGKRTSNCPVRLYPPSASVIPERLTMENHHCHCADILSISKMMSPFGLEIAFIPEEAQTHIRLEFVVHRHARQDFVSARSAA